MKSWWMILVVLLTMMTLSGCTKPESTSPVEEQSAPEPTNSPLNAHTPMPVGTPVPVDEGEGQTASIVALALDAAAEHFNVPKETIEVLKVEAVEWPNSCLGCAAPDTFCAQVITPGYRIVLKMGDATREAHTDAQGKHIRFCDEGGGDIGPVGDQRPAPDQAWTQLQALLDYWQAQKPGYGLDQVQSRWEGNDITPPGLLGSTHTLFRADRWNVAIDCPVIPDPLCGVTLSHAEMGTVWKGTVDATGKVVEDATPTSVAFEHPCEEKVEPKDYDSWAGVEIKPMDDGFHFTHRIPYVCCAKVIFSAGGTAADGVIRIVETNVGEICRCMCPYVVEGEVHGLPSGTYTVEFWGIQKLPAHELTLQASTKVIVP
jgi:hypothetical protein